jgi:regulatory protein
MKQSKEYLVKDYLLFLLTRRDYSTAQLIEKALNKGYDGIDTKRAVSELTQAGLINDKRMAENIIEGYQGVKGKVWIKQKLLLKKIPSTTIDILLSDAHDLNQANEMFKRKIIQKYHIDSWENLDPKLKQKILHYIARQGFSNPWDILNSLSKQSDI